LNEGDSIALDAKLAKLLKMGTTRFDLEVAMVARVEKDRYEIIAIHSPESFPVRAGAVFSLEETFCKNTLDSERPIGIEQISESNWAESLERAAFPFSAYLGAAVTFEGASYGTLSFASFEPRKDRFNGTEKDLIRLMARWIGYEIAKHNEQKAPIDSAIKHPAPAAPVPATSTASHQPVDEPAAVKIKEAPSRSRKRADPRYVEHVIDPNRILQRVENELRTLAGSSVNFAMKLDPGLGFAAAQSLPLKAIVRTLVMNARDAMPEGGELIVETANLEIATGEPGQVPALAPDRYVTLSFMDSGREPDADALSRLFDHAPGNAEQSSSDDRLALSYVYRALQISGGDLSVNIEPGRGSTFTVYLPRAREQVRAPRKAAPALAPAMPSSIAH